MAHLLHDDCPSCATPDLAFAQHDHAHCAHDAMARAEAVIADTPPGPLALGLCDGPVRQGAELAATVLERFPAPSTIARPMAQYAHLLDALVGEPS